MEGFVRIITMGCAKNEVDSDKMRAELEAAGFTVLGASDDGSAADVTIVNTCSFIEEATQESIDMILDLVEQREARGSRIQDARELRAEKIVVTGCMPSRYGGELADEIPEVAAFVPVTGEGAIVEVVRAVLGNEPPSCDPDEAPPVDGLRGRTLQEPYAYVKISDGCDRFCSFCTIPFIRGRYASRPAGEIVAEVDGLVALGAREVILIGQDTGIWGDDLEEGCQEGLLRENSLACLLSFLAQRHPETWFRVMYLQPRRTDDRLLDAIAAHDNVCSYLDIPLQHCSERVLADMNREGSGREFLELLARIRERIPGVALRTTVIAGFPGETDEEAGELADFIERAEFDYAGVFEYSQEDGTVAGEREDQVDQREKVARAQAVRDAAEAVGFARAQAHVGEVCDVLVCGVDDDTPADGEQLPCLWGRAMFQAPDVDGIVTLRGPAGLVGSIVPVRVTGAAGYDLEGEVQE